MHIENKSNKVINEFIKQFPDQKRNRVINFLLILGFDIARKLGQNNQAELYQTMKQLSKFIINDFTQNGQSELREEIKKIQQQLVQLNSLFNNSESEQIQSKSQDIQRTQAQTKQQQNHNRFYTQNDMEDQFNVNIRQEQQHSTNSKNQFKPAKRNKNQNKSPLQQNNNNLTAKITESPPPPMVYQKTKSKNFNIKPHLDDHQIKQLLYSNNERIYQDDFDSISNRGHQYNQSPKAIKYTLNIQNFDNIGQRFQTHETNKKHRPQQTSNSSRQKKRVPAYLQNVESKIKPKIDQDKQAFKNLKNYDEDSNQQYNFNRFSSQQMTANFQNNKNFIHPTQQSDTYYEIQQYLINQKNQNFHLSPVQEMRTDHEIISSKKKPQNFRDNTKSSLKSLNDSSNLKQQQQQQFFEQHVSLPYSNSITPIQVSDFQMSKQQSDLSFDAFRKKAQFTSPYAISLQQSSQPVQTAQKPDRNDEESSESFSNFTPPNKEIREFLSKQCIYQDQA